MTRTLPRAEGLRFVNGLRSATGIDLQFKPSLAIIAGQIDKLGLDIRSFRVPLKRAVQQVVIPSIRKNFDTGGRPPWQPLAPQTIQRKGSSAKLVDTGSLRRNMGFLSIWTITRDYAVIQDLPQRIWYGKVHQAGNGGSSKALKVVGTGAKSQQQSVNISEGGIPARPFVMLTSADERKIESVFRHWLDERIMMRLGKL